MTEQRILEGVASDSEISLWARRNENLDDVTQGAIRALVSRARTAQFYRERVEALEKIFRQMPAPWRDVCADILANGGSALLPCGHPRRALVAGDEGTHYCSECERAV